MSGGSLRERSPRKMRSVSPHAKAVITTPCYRIAVICQDRAAPAIGPTLQVAFLTVRWDMEISSKTGAPFGFGEANDYQCELDARKAVLVHRVVGRNPARPRNRRCRP